MLIKEQDLNDIKENKVTLVKFLFHGTEPVTKGTRYSINCFLHK
tara:strand:+ start:58 stop:189 length:132 start_codon:yes stop_codon:yes gene_type:complete